MVSVTGFPDFWITGFRITDLRDSGFPVYGMSGLRDTGFRVTDLRDSGLRDTGYRLTDSRGSELQDTGYRIAAMFVLFCWESQKARRWP